MKIVTYILQFYDDHHTVDGGVRTEHHNSYDEALRSWGRIISGTCTQHGPQRNCFRNMTITKQTSSIDRIILERQ